MLSDAQYKGYGKSVSMYFSTIAQVGYMSGKTFTVQNIPRALKKEPYPAYGFPLYNFHK